MLKRILFTLITMMIGAAIGAGIVWLATGHAGASLVAAVLMLPIFGLLGLGLGGALLDRNKNPAAMSAYAGNAGNIRS
ncbi:hypothetical protein [Maricaulis maris]|jgi:hypothetical protein|uniref:hypothetical protein n=1 Tax=Maricaulis maris TaxID=74318 RepID=UPI0029252269|nr:hypothetical protein MACH15_06750 [Maricaulis maris]